MMSLSKTKLLNCDLAALLQRMPRPQRIIMQSKPFEYTAVAQCLLTLPTQILSPQEIFIEIYFRLFVKIFKAIRHRKLYFVNLETETNLGKQSIAERSFQEQLSEPRQTSFESGR